MKNPKRKFKSGLLYFSTVVFLLFPSGAAFGISKQSNTGKIHAIRIGPHLRNGFSLYSEKRKVGMTYFLAHIENDQISRISVLSEKLFRNMQSDLQKIKMVLEINSAKKLNRSVAVSCSTPVTFQAVGPSADRIGQILCADDLEIGSRLKFKDWVNLAADLSK